MITDNGKKMTKVLITGASGFIGSFLCEESIRRGWSTWAAVRTSSNRHWLKDDALNFVTLDLADKSRLKQQLSELQVRFDVVIHAAGATKCLKPEDFDFNNYQCTRHFVEALAENDMMPRQFIYLSSLSALYGSVYGNSKLKTENWLNRNLGELSEQNSDLDGNGKETSLVVFRPTGVYGPRERDYFLMVKSIRQHIDFAVGFKPQKLTFVYVRDLVGAIMCAIERRTTHGIFNVTDGSIYSSRTFSDLIQKELGIKGVIHITSPLWLLKIISTISECWAKISGKPTTLNRDKYRIMAQRDWTCDIEPLKKELSYFPKWQLPEGVKETIAWYKKENWI